MSMSPASDLKGSKAMNACASQLDSTQRNTLFRTKILEHRKIAKSAFLLGVLFVACGPKTAQVRAPSTPPLPSSNIQKAQDFDALRVYGIGCNIDRGAGGYWKLTVWTDYRGGDPKVHDWSEFLALNENKATVDKACTTWFSSAQKRIDQALTQKEPGQSKKTKTVTEADSSNGTTLPGRPER
jgi:hypothetical protein